jgi:hypothetical protein
MFLQNRRDLYRPCENVAIEKKYLFADYLLPVG